MSNFEKDNKKRRHPELLIPAGSLEVLKIAVIYGADAVYIGGECVFQGFLWGDGGFYPCAVRVRA